MTHEGVHEIFSRIAQKYPLQSAIERGVETLTYSELEDRANRLANLLISSGAKKGSFVAILSEDSTKVIIAVLATLKAGCVFIPLDPNTPSKRIAAMIEEVSPSFFLIDSSFYEKTFEIGLSAAPGARLMSLNGMGGGDEAPAGVVFLQSSSTLRDNRKVEVEWGPDDLCYIYFTSGSTGRPKGIAGRLKAIEHFVKWEIGTFGVGEGTRVSQFTTPAFDAFLRDVFTPLCAGGTICIPETRLSGQALAEWIESKRINLVHCAPSLFRSMLGEELKPDYFAALRYILMAGEPLLPIDVKRWTEIFGDRVQLVNLYGPSETTMTKFFYLVQDSDQLRRSIPIGKPMEGARALIMDGNGRACTHGVIGEIYIRTPYRAHGYYNRPDLTSEVFIQNPFNSDPRDIIYRTGDLGRVLEDGNFEFLGRKDQQVKVRGIRIELGEIENLLRSHTSIRDVVVVDSTDVEGNKFLCAYLVLGQEIEMGALREYLAGFLPENMLPSAFIQLDALPRTISGKVDRRLLPAPDNSLSRAKNYVAPRTPLEESLAAIWSQLLSVNRVSIEDNFFEIGGHSLLATQLLSRIRLALHIEIPLRVLFEAPTIAKLALAITQLQLSQANSAEMTELLEELRMMPESVLDLALEREVAEQSIAQTSTKYEEAK